jgi:hypothetical protein
MPELINHSTPLEQLIEHIALQGWLKRFKPGDRLVLADDVLQAALARQHPLNRTEYDALLASPLTLRRLQVLADQRAQSESLRFVAPTLVTNLTSNLASNPSTRPNQPALASVAAPLPKGVLPGMPADPAANQPWRHSHCILRAAASATPASQVQSEDGWWRVGFSKAAHGWQIILKLDLEAPFAALALDQALVWQVRDGQGQVLLQGELDEAGELEARWPFADAPAVLLAAAGGKIDISSLQR